MVSGPERRFLVQVTHCVTHTQHQLLLLVKGESLVAQSQSTPQPENSRSKHTTPRPLIRRPLPRTWRTGLTCPFIPSTGTGCRTRRPASKTSSSHRPPPAQRRLTGKQPSIPLSLGRRAAPGHRLPLLLLLPPPLPPAAPSLEVTVAPAERLTGGWEERRSRWSGVS